MKTRKTKHEPTNGPSAQAIRLEFAHSTASKVYVAASFNDWRPDATLMVSLGDGRWIKDLILPPGVYEYRIVADGQWLPDPLASETVPNPFGGVNSILRVPPQAASQ